MTRAEKVAEAIEDYVQAAHVFSQTPETCKCQVSMLGQCEHEVAFKASKEAKAKAKVTLKAALVEALR